MRKDTNNKLNRQIIWQKYKLLRNFFRIKRPTHTRSEKSPLTILKVRDLKACTCLSNTYTTYTHHIHALCVCGVYDLCTCLANTYTPLNYLINKLLYPCFCPRVYVCRLILKKSSLVVSLCHNSKSVLIPL